MSEIQANSPMYNIQTGTPLYNYSNNNAVQTQQPQQQTVSVSSPSTSQVYQYPQTSLYNSPSKQPIASKRGNACGSTSNST